jgi:hypothetical protein
LVPLNGVGQLLVDDGVCGGTQIFPSTWIDDITLNGSQDAWTAGVLAPIFPGRKMHYWSKWHVDVILSRPKAAFRLRDEAGASA